MHAWITAFSQAERTSKVRREGGGRSGGGKKGEKIMLEKGEGRGLKEGVREKKRWKTKEGGLRKEAKY